MTPEHQALQELVGVLERLGVAHMLTGSFASSFHGRPRLTHDADVVIDPTPDQLDALVASFNASGHYVDDERARDALRRRGQFNVIDPHASFKFDLIICKNRPWSREELGRRRAVELAPGLRVALASAEDTILSKLEWAKKAGGSEKQLEDAAGILALNPELDRAYIERWAGDLGVLDDWRRLAATPSHGI